MCMLTYYPENTVPADAEALRNGAEYNSDGHGYAIVAGNRLIVRKSMDADYLIAEFMRDRASHPRGPALFHSRIGTGGTVDKYNCHPFRFRGDRRTIVAHNGILPKLAQPSKKDPRSDTRYAADQILPHKFGHLGYAPNRAALAKWLGPFNKFVILTVNPVYAQRAYIINESSGVWDAGVWYSNHDYLGSTQWVSGRLWAPRHDDLYDDECPYCGKMGHVNSDTFVCETCGTCLDCLTPVEGGQCDCYLPNVKRRPVADRDEEEYAGWWSDVMKGRQDDAVTEAETAWRDALVERRR